MRIWFIFLVGDRRPAEWSVWNQHWCNCCCVRWTLLWWISVLFVVFFLAFLDKNQLVQGCHCVLQGKCGTSRAYPCRKSKGCPNFCWLHDIFLYLGYVFTRIQMKTSYSCSRLSFSNHERPNLSLSQSSF